MTQRTLTLQLVSATLVALLLVVFWALDPILTAYFILSRPHITDAELIRLVWHFRLIPPEWVSGPNQLFRWQEAEVYARLTVVFVAWTVSSIALIMRHRRGKPRHLTGRSSQPLADAESFS